MSTDSLEAIIVDSDVNRINRLKLAARAEGSIDVSSVQSCKEACALLEQRNRSCNLLFLSPNLTRREVFDFVKEARTTPGGRICAYILLIDPNQSDPHALTRRLLDGIDGFLQEPYSVDGLHQLVDIARELIAKDLTNRARSAVEIAVVDLLTYIDASSSKSDEHISKHTSAERMKSLQKTLEEVYEMDQELFSDTIVQIFEKLHKRRGPRAPRPVSGYEGASARVRKRMKRKQLKSVLEDCE
jgi:hypothetical protein